MIHGNSRAMGSMTANRPFAIDSFHPGLSPARNDSSGCGRHELSLCCGIIAYHDTTSSLNDSYYHNWRFFALLFSNRVLTMQATAGSLDTYRDHLTALRRFIALAGSPSSRYRSPCSIESIRLKRRSHSVSVKCDRTYFSTGIAAWTSP